MNEKHRKQINTLTKWVTVKIGPSKVDGVGLIALYDMPKGTKLYCDIMPEIFHVPYSNLKNNAPEYVYDRIVAEMPLVVKDEPFTYPNARLVAFCNHSDTPNYDAHTDMLLEDVKAGDEIFEDYRQIEGWEVAFPFLVK